ncbi:MAG: response regulator [Burkholderiales bacterium]|nr:response regulator [Burkholderiales bacterium]
MLAFDRAKENRLLVTIVLMMAGILWMDLQTRLGLAEWILYLLPVGLCLRQRRASLPLYIVAVSSALTIAGFFASPPGYAVEIAGINRAIGIVAMAVIGYLVRYMIIARERERLDSWIQQGRAAVGQAVLGQQTVADVATKATAALAGYLGAVVAALYRVDGERLLLEGGWALDSAGDLPRILQRGQGLAGQMAVSGEARVVQGLAESHLRISSALGSSEPRHIVILPATADLQVCGVVELGLLHLPVDEAELLALCRALAEPIGAALQAALYRQRQADLLEETQRQAEELQAQQEELRVSNEELEEQSRALRESQSRLEDQQAELETTNVRLEEQTERLERQKQELLVTQRAMRLNADKLEQANRYKSEFLANMSHELRTPLNSSLILAKLLADNRNGNLTPDQVRYAESILSANNDLLTLINDILDLAKIESGHADTQIEAVALETLLARLQDTFAPIAADRGLGFSIDVEPAAPATLVTDPQRLLQILRNLLSNAFKFTEAGEVRLQVRAQPGQRIAFAVRDTGVGIPPEQQAIIFEPFRQADGSTSRKYGGTGLGLSISRELARLLGGDITVHSQQGQGSTFTLDIPVVAEPAAGAASSTASAAHNAPAAPPAQSVQAPAAAALPEGAGSAPAPAAGVQRPLSVTPAVAPAGAATPATATHGIEDDRHRARPGRLILAVEDDPHFARVLYDLVHEMDFDCVLSASGREALELARTLQPAGVLLDVGLPDESGLSVLERLKRDPATRHIPVHMLSLHDRAQTALELGAVGYLMKPLAREQIAQAVHKLQAKLQQRLHRILVVEDDPALRDNIGLLLKTDQVEIDAVGTVADALDHLSRQTYDCMVMDLALPDASGYDLLERMAEGGHYAFPPVIVYTGRVLSADEEQRLRRYSRSIIIKGARSPERLLDEVTLFLHSVESALPPDQQRLLREARQRDSVLDGRTILLAEDDVRNIFALSSVLEPLGVKLEIARNGREALDRLAGGTRVDLVLMDIMMPEMDGLTAMRELRRRPKHAKLPVIALTAKAMPEDRQHCLDAGADDYISKPIDVDKLVSLCRVWMPK